MYAPGVTHNLLSLGQLMKNGYYAIFYDENSMIYDKKNGIPIYTVKMTANKMFPVMFKTTNFNAHDSCDGSVLWHRCYGHLNFGGLH